jgi:hypothetical protein
MNWKRLVLATIAAFVFMFLFGFVWNGKLMHFAYDEAITLWRDKADIPILISGYLIMAFFIALTYACVILCHDAWAGLRLGMMLAFINIGVTSSCSRSSRLHLTFFGCRSLALSCSLLSPVLLSAPFTDRP